MDKKLHLFSALLGLMISLFSSLWLPAISSAALPKPLALTDSEKNWLKQHPVVTLGADPSFAPFEFFSQTGRYTGMAADYMAIIEQRLGIRLEPVLGLTWTEATARAQKGEIDILPCVGITQERRQFFNYTAPYLQFVRVIVTRKDTTAITHLKDLEKVPFGVQANSSHEGFIKEHTAYTPLLFDTLEAAMLALSRNEIQAVVANLAAVSHVIQTSGFTHLKISGHASDEIKPLAMAVRKDWPELVTLLDKALASITQEEHLAIRQQWIRVDLPEQKDRETRKPAIDMTPLEQKFIATHTPLTFSEVDWAPLSIISQDTQFSGLIADYLDLITRRSGLRFSFEKSDSWSEVLKKYADKKIQMIPAIGIDDPIGRPIVLSNPFVSFPLVIVTKNDVSYIKDTDELNGREVAVGRGYTSFNYLKKYYHQIHLVETDNVRQGLLKVSNGQVFAFVGHMAVVIDSLQTLGLKNLKIAGETSYTFEHRMGIDPKYPEALSIINKTLGSITEEEHRSIYSKWFSVEYKKGIDYRLIWKMGIIAGALLVIFLLWNWKMAREIAGRRKAEEQFQAMAANVPGAIFQARISLTGVFEFIYVSQGMETHFGLSPKALVNGTQRLEMGEEDQKLFEQRLTAAVKQGEKFEFTGRLAMEKITWVRLAATPYQHKAEAPIYNGLMLDITQRKLAEQERLASEQKIMAMSQAMDDALVMIDSQGMVLFWNPAAEKFFGYTAREAMGKEFHAMATPPDIRDQARLGLVEFSKTGQGAVFGATIQTIAMKRSGDTVPVDVTLSSFQMDNQWFAVGTIRDIADRKKKEDELKSHMEDLERFNRITLSREERMIELKEEINQLLKQLGKEDKYTIR